MRSGRLEAALALLPGRRRPWHTAGFDLLYQIGFGSRGGDVVSGIRHSAVVGMIVAAAAAVSAGCSNNKGYNGDPGARPLPAGQTCQGLQAQLSKLSANGVQSKVEASQSGRKLSPQAQADVDQYNKLLNDYLGARCHVPASPH